MSATGKASLVAILFLLGVCSASASDLDQPTSVVFGGPFASQVWPGDCVLATTQSFTGSLTLSLYQACATLTAANATVPNGGDVTFEAGATIALDNDFSVEDGATFTTTINATVCDCWRLNLTGQTSVILTNSQPSLVNVQSVERLTVMGDEFIKVNASGLPDYQLQLDQIDINGLNARPNAMTDFDAGQTTAVAGQVVSFADDIGYDGKCTPGAGQGFWPPGPECPTQQDLQVFFPLVPTTATQDCPQKVGTLGLYVNGVAVFGWSDAQSYMNGGKWRNSAVAFELLDLDICGGHGTQLGIYHQHPYSACLAAQLGDDGSARSPLWGVAADGYPIYGPYQAAAVLAKPCWKTRDYNTPDPLTGCGMAGKRTCQLVDNEDPSMGKTMLPPADHGPDTSAQLSTGSGNVIGAVSGVFFEDYWFDSTCPALGAEYLDKHNGHQTTALGYHYHVVAVDKGNGKLAATFPYNIGPNFAGQLAANAVTTCGSN